MGKCDMCSESAESAHASACCGKLYSRCAEHNAKNMAFVAALAHERRCGIPHLARTFEERYVPEPNTGCWIWMGRLDRDGYGIISIAGKSRKAHRYAYQTMIGEIPYGMTIDHLCRHTFCVNPAHMDVVTAEENTRRGNASRVLSGQCRRGHRFMPRTGGCKVCQRIRGRRMDEKRRIRRQASNASAGARSPKP